LQKRKQVVFDRYVTAEGGMENLSEFQKIPPAAFPTAEDALPDSLNLLLHPVFAVSQI
jgi:hypothetical protein